MKFKDLKNGDKLFIVNEGENFGMRVEEHIIEEITEAYGGECLAFKLDDTTTAYIYNTLIDDNKCVEIMDNISKERDNIETELILNGNNLEN